MRGLRRLGAMQGRAESLMTLTLAPMEPDGVTVVDGLEEQVYTQHPDTAGKAQGGNAASRDFVSRTVTVGGVSRPVLEGGLHIPISAEIPRAGDQGVGWEYVVLAVGEYDDPALLNRRYLVVSVGEKSFATARRLDVVEVPR